MSKTLLSLGRNLSTMLYLAGRFLNYGLVPRWYYRKQLGRIMDGLTAEERLMVEKRVAYYNKLKPGSAITGGTTVDEYRFPFSQKRRFTKYFFDLYEVVRYFGKQERFCYIHGDVTEIPEDPTFVKSRPVAGDNANSVLLKLNKRRHYTLTKHDKPFREKKDMLVSRTTWANPSPQRRCLCEKFWNHPLCDVGKTRVEENEDLPQTVKPFLSKRQQLEYKFVACVEGVDVATSLKWVMSSNSVAVSPPMHYETWFMEGTLIPNYHYIEVKPDFSDLVEKLEYYIAHPEEAEAIVCHAHDYVAQFLNKKMERATQLAVADKYFKMTKGQDTYQT